MGLSNDGIDNQTGGAVMKVQDAMTTDVATIGPEALLKDAATELVRRRISGMPVVDADGKVLGVLSETDILAKEGDEQPHGGLLRWLVNPADPWLKARFEAVTVADAMSAPARTIAPNRPVAEAASFMLDEEVNRLPVVDSEGTLVGVVSRGDLVRAFARTDAEIRAEIEEDVIHEVMWLSPGAVDVTVTDGVVTLAGEVASESDAVLLPTFARRVPGVVDVSSTLTHRM
jgi:CBS domain-containing protein